MAKVGCRLLTIRKPLYLTDNCPCHNSNPSVPLSFHIISHLRSIYYYGRWYDDCKVFYLVLKFKG
nr:MAG TPA: hypothetical protein [Caudoviricetes sp.]